MTVQLALCILTWCFTLLYILTVGLDVTGMNGLLIMFNMTLEMFGYCFFCTELATTGTLIARQSYEFRWEEHDPKIQKMISTIVARSQLPLRITACGFITVNVELFAKVRMQMCLRTNSRSRMYSPPGNMLSFRSLRQLTRFSLC